MAWEMEKKELKGLIFDIQGFAVHDGPGCRTMIFMKGGPLKCEWCSNPEGQRPTPEIMYSRRSCRRETYTCVEACPFRAISISKPGDYITIDRSKCADCASLDCASACYNNALRVVGKYVTVEDLMRIIKRDRAYWGDGGGVTITGGEPLYQPEFVIEVLKECYESYIHTTLETCAHVPWKYLEEAVKYLDWLFVDLKHMDPVKHLEGTGATNELILENIRRLAKIRGPRLIIRIPVVPGYNDSLENMEASARFLSDIKVEEVNLLPFHRLGASKYEQLDREYAYKETKPPSREKLEEICMVFKRRGLKCYVGSNTPF